AQRVGIASYHVLPISALEGDNVVNASPHSPWYQGLPLLRLLETLQVEDDDRLLPLRLRVQWVVRHGGDSTNDFRGYAGRIDAGVLRLDDEVLVQPSGLP